MLKIQLKGLRLVQSPTRLEQLQKSNALQSHRPSGDVSGFSAMETLLSTTPCCRYLGTISIHQLTLPHPRFAIRWAEESIRRLLGGWASWIGPCGPFH